MNVLSRVRSAAAIFTLFASASGAIAADYKFGHYFPTEDFRGVTATKFAENAKAASANFNIAVYPSESLVKGREALQATSRGTVDFYSVFAGYLTGSVGLMKVFTIPFPEEQYDDARMMAFANDPGVISLLDKALEKSNVKLLGFVNSSGQSPMFFRAPLENLAGVSGRKIRGIGGYSDTALQELGASIVFMSTAEQFIQLETGGVDGVITTEASYVNLGLGQVAPYATANTVVRAPYALMMNKRKWDRLSDADKTALMKAVNETIDWSNSNFDQESERLAKGTAEQSKAVLRFSEADWDLARKVRAKAMDDFAKENGADGMALLEIYKRYQ